MLLNFCDPRLRPEIKCSTISTEGYEVNNLITDSDKGFLAYSCIKPPVDIDITFLCNICINHILIWPSVGSQKSVGFRLYAKSSNDNNTPYILLSIGHLDQLDSGLLIYSSNVNHETIPTPSNFLKRYTKPSIRYLTTCVSMLRVCIYKTEKSVPALQKIEVWGTVSPRCGRDTIESIHNLWFKRESDSAESVEKAKCIKPLVATIKTREVSESSLEIPECFLDPLTWEIMTQPIILPSGKIIDQKTLERHEENEAIWGRVVTDPFTGKPFNEHHKPVVATALKMRIDKFLLENSNVEEIQKLPRVLGHALPSTAKGNRILELSKSTIKGKVASISLSDSKHKFHCSVTNEQKNKEYCHKLPVIVMSSKHSINNLTCSAKRKKLSNPCTTYKEVQDDKSTSTCVNKGNVNIENNTDSDVDITVVPNLKRFNVAPDKHDIASASNSCACCSNGTFYQLPCKHVLCRKILVSIENNRCTTCGTSYENCEIKRIYE